MGQRQRIRAAGRRRQQDNEEPTSVLRGRETASPATVARLLRRMKDEPATSALRPLVAQQLMALQATHGNQYVQRIAASIAAESRRHGRKPAGSDQGPLSSASGQGRPHVQRSVGDDHGLASSRFAGDPILEACHEGNEPLRVGDSGPAVKKIQEALIELAFPLPKHGADGTFGSEMKSALKRFQRSYRLTGREVRQGVVGQQTMGLLDGLFGRSSGAGHPAAPRDGVLFNGSQLIVYREGRQVASVAALSGFSGKQEWQKGEGPIPDGRYAISPDIKRPPVAKRQNTLLGAYAIDSGYQELTATDLLVWPYPSMREETVPCPGNPRRRCLQVSVVDVWGSRRIKIQGSAVVGKPGGGTVTRSGFYIHGGLPERSWTSGCIKVQDESIFGALLDFGHPVELVVKKGGA